MNSLEIVRNKFKNDGFANTMGIILDDLTGNTIRMHMKLDPSKNNFYGRAHGGAIYGLADAAFSVLGNNCNNISVAVECSISYHASPEDNAILHVDGVVLSSSRKIGTFLFTVYTEESSGKTLIATMKSTLYRTGKHIVEG